jgi:hypothetical protein
MRAPPCCSSHFLLQLPLKDGPSGPAVLGHGVVLITFTCSSVSFLPRRSGHHARAQAVMERWPGPRRS